MTFLEKNQIHVKFGNNVRPLRPFALKLLKPFGILWGTSQVERNSIETCGYAVDNAL